jgi:glycosyltransferase involved in cell wall biosynthesis
MKPFVSVCTPTYNRRPFLSAMFECFRRQNYPVDRMEWVIVDDGSDCVRDLVEAAAIPQIKYVRMPHRVTLGRKRNEMHSHCIGDILVYMDDDDYYPPERVSHAVEMLEANPWAMVAGSSVMHIYFKHIDKIIEFGPYGPRHATAGTFAFRKELLQQTSYDDAATTGEEKTFLKDYAVPLVQLNPRKVILCFSHEHNTFDKRILLQNPERTILKETALKISDFVRDEVASDFYLFQLPELLKSYEAGKREFSVRVGNRVLMGNEILAHLNQQQAYIQKLETRVRELSLKK